MCQATHSARDFVILNQPNLLEFNLRNKATKKVAGEPFHVTHDFVRKCITARLLLVQNSLCSHPIAFNRPQPTFRPINHHEPTF